MEKWTVADIPSQAGNLAVVTGANSGIGRHTACRRLHPRLTRARRIAHRCLREQGAHLRCEGKNGLCRGFGMNSFPLLRRCIAAKEHERNAIGRYDCLALPPG